VNNEQLEMIEDEDYNQQ